MNDPGETLQNIVSKYADTILNKKEKEMIQDVLLDILHPTNRSYSLRTILVSLYCLGKDSKDDNIQSH